MVVGVAAGQSAEQLIRSLPHPPSSCSVLSWPPADPPTHLVNQPTLHQLWSSLHNLNLGLQLKVPLFISLHCVAPLQATFYIFTQPNNTVNALSTRMKYCIFLLLLILLLLLFQMQMLSLLLVPLLAPPLADSCSASKHHPHFLRRNPPLFTLNKNSTKTEKLCAIQLRGVSSTSNDEAMTNSGFRT